MGVLGGALGLILAAIGVVVSVDLEVLFGPIFVSAALIVLVAFFGTVPVLLSSIRAPRSDEEHLQRLALLRSGLGLAGFLVAGLFGLAIYGMELVMVFRSVATAPPSLKAIMYAGGVATAAPIAPIGWLFGLIPLGAGLLSAWAIRPKEGQMLRSFDLALAGVALLLAMSTGSYLGTQSHDLFPIQCKSVSDQILDMTDEQLQYLKRTAEDEIEMRRDR
ncbi:MAG: hypothetical protein EA397_17305 [Deltaproteobacteria bacterium]|nr:MAG: hypothetical protein EA397_17305 [Deltaproteobacteria bacterium]